MIPADRAHVHVAANTHPGMSGKNNEDRFALAAFHLPGEKPQSVLFAVVADGIGGHHAGEVAAEIAVETISAGVAASDGSQPLETLNQVIQQASEKIHLRAQSDTSQYGMGATCCCALIIGQRLFIAFVGDSRIYLINSSGVRQLTTDHTWIQEALDAGVITPEQSAGHPNAHVIRRYLGAPTPVEVDTRLRLAPDDSAETLLTNQGIALQPGDQLLLCSDGLTDLVGPEEIQAVLLKHQGPNQPNAINELIALANARGGHDNITLIALQMPHLVQDAAPTMPIQIAGNGPGSSLAPAARPRARLLTACLSGVLLLALLLGALAGAYWLYSTRTAITPTPTLATTTPVISVTALPSATTPATAPATATTSAAGVTPSVITPAASATPRAPATSGPTLTPWPTSTP